MSKRATVAWVIAVDDKYVAGWEGFSPVLTVRQTDALRFAHNHPLQAKASAAIVQGNVVRLVAREHPGIHAAWAALEKERKEHAATQELHSRSGKLIAEALGAERQCRDGWLFENMAADVRRVVMERDALRVRLTNEALAREVTEGALQAWKARAEAAEMHSAPTAHPCLVGGVDATTWARKSESQRAEIERLTATLANVRRACGMA